MQKKEKENNGYKKVQQAQNQIRRWYLHNYAPQTFRVNRNNFPHSQLEVTKLMLKTLS